MKKVIIILVTLLSVLLLVGGLYIYRENTSTEYDEYTTYLGEITVSYRNAPRLTNCLVLYDKEYQRNEYGYEILVERDGGFIIEADSLVELRDGTYILSGHGTAADFLRELKIGDIVKIDRFGKARLSRSQLSSSMKIIELENKKVDDIIDEMTRGLYDIDTHGIALASEDATLAIREFELMFSEGAETEEIDLAFNRVMELIGIKRLYAMESRAVEGRGMWHRPNGSGIDESTLDGVKELALRLQEMGINTLYVETLWHGMTTYYSDLLGIAHPRMRDYSYGEYGNDYILALISECHKVGVEVHAWVSLLHVGDDWGNAPSYVKPQWLVSDIDGSFEDKILDPSNPEVREYLAASLSEMVTKYDFDGISYDYVRYSEAGYFGDGGEYVDSGFCSNSERLFAEVYGYSGDDLISDVKVDASVRESWQDFKRDAVSRLVHDLSQLLREKSPRTIISTSPYGIITDAREIYMQDTLLWMEKGYVDVVLPMIYTDDAEYYGRVVGEYSRLSNMALQYGGIYVMYNGGSILLNQEQVVAAVSAGSGGYSFFATQNYITRNPKRAEKIMDALLISTCRTAAVSPTSDVNEIFTAWKGQLLDRCERIYAPYMSDDELLALSEFDRQTSFEMETPRDVYEMLLLLSELGERVEKFESDPVTDRICDQIDYIYNILDVAITRHMIRFGYWNVETTPTRPSVYDIIFNEEI